MTRLAAMLATVLSSSTLGTSAFVDLPKTVIWNASASAPIGLYSLQADRSIDVTDLVAIVPPPPTAEFMAARGYLPIGVPMMKRILALPGQTVCRQGLDIIVYGATVGRARERDSADRKMPEANGPLQESSAPEDRSEPVFRCSLSRLLGASGRQVRNRRIGVRREGRRAELRHAARHERGDLRHGR